MSKEMARTFYDSVAEGNLEYVKKFFNEYKPYFNPKRVTSVINAAATFGREDIISFMLSENNDIVVLKMHIMNSVNAGHLETFKLLVKHNKDNNKSYEFDYFKVLEDSCIKGHLHFVEYLIDSKLVDIHKNDGHALCLACKNGELDIVKLLIKNGANPYVGVYEPYTNAVKNKHFHVANYLRGLKSKTVKYYE